jgi:putative DNA-invertase from lambdoid prophage Rac
MKVVGYARVSTEEQASSGVSLEAQQQQITGYAMMKGWQIGEFFVERGVSGSVPLAERPEGRRMLETVAAGDVIVTSRLDRAFRSAADALGTLEELKAEGVGLHMIDLGGDVCGNGISKLVFTILSAVAENERDRIRERIREVKRHLASQGVYGGGKRPFGFDVGRRQACPEPRRTGCAQAHEGNAPRGQDLSRNRRPVRQGPKDRPAHPYSGRRKGVTSMIGCGEAGGRGCSMTIVKPGVISGRNASCCETNPGMCSRTKGH